MKYFSLTILLPLFITQVSFSQTNPAIDTSFGINGYAEHNFYPNQWGYFSAIYPLPDNKILGVGKGFQNGLSEVIRFDQNGNVDLSFNIYSIFFSSVQFSFLESEKKNGNIFLTGTNGYFNNNGVYLGSSPVVIKLNSDGTVDTSFGQTGCGASVFGHTNESNYSRGIVVNDDGSIYVSCDSSNHYHKIYKLLSTGIIDSSFGINGVLNLPSQSDESIIDFRKQSDGKFLLSFYKGAFPPPIYLERYNSDWSIDSTFNGVGSLTFSFASNRSYENDLLITADKIFLIGYYDEQITSNRKMLCVSLNMNGSIDSSFGTNGVADLPSGILSGAYLESNNKILLAGYNNDSLMLIRFNADLTFDSQFGNGGIYFQDYQSKIEGHSLFVSDSFLFVGGCIDSILYLPMGVLSKYKLDFTSVTNYAINIFPNPNSGNFEIELSLPDDENLGIEIYNSVGVLVYSSSKNYFMAGRNYLHFNSSKKNPSGLYFLKISLSNGTSVLKKFVKG